MERFHQIMTWKPSLNITKTLTMGEPTVVKMESNALRRAQDLLSAGKDMDSVCREINPDMRSGDQSSSSYSERRWNRYLSRNAPHGS
jgi:methanogenic corrinoid protein MtbC1